MPTVSMGNSGIILPADKVSYDNTASGLEADNVQDAIDEINSNLKNETKYHVGDRIYLISPTQRTKNLILGFTVQGKEKVRVRCFLTKELGDDISGVALHGHGIFSCYCNASTLPGIEVTESWNVGIGTDNIAVSTNSNTVTFPYANSVFMCVVSASNTDNELYFEFI